MADITAISSIADGTDLTAAQVTGIINKIDIRIYNILTGNKYDGANYEEHGDAGHKFEGAGQLAELRKQREYFVGILSQMPVYLVSQYDDPSL